MGCVTLDAIYLRHRLASTSLAESPQPGRSTRRGLFTFCAQSTPIWSEVKVNTLSTLPLLTC